MRPTKYKSFLLVNCLLGVFLFQSCKGGSVLVESHEKLHTRGVPLKKVICIEPDFVWLKTGKKIENIVLNSEKLQKKYQRLLLENANKNGIEFEILDANTLEQGQVDYFNSLLPLKKNILFALRTQERKGLLSHEEKEKYLKNPNRKYFTEGRAIDSKYSALADTYGTPYFCINGIISVRINQKNKWIGAVVFPPLGIYLLLRPPSETVYYNVLVDVSRGEILHREVRAFRVPMLSANLDAVLYDSFNILTERKNE